MKKREIKNGLEAISALRGPSLIPLIMPNLDAKQDVLIAAVNAIAAATEIDLMHNREGQLRPIDEIAANYRELVRNRKP